MLFPIFLYIIPFVLVPVLGRKIPNLKKFSAITFLFGSFLGEFAFLAFSSRFEHSTVLSVDFWWDMLAFYPMAAFPLGFWIVALAFVGYRVARCIRHQYSTSPTLIYSVGLSLGAIVGASFMRLYIELATAFGEGQYPRDGVLPFVMAGIVCGAGIGLVCVRFSANYEEVQR